MDTREAIIVIYIYLTVKSCIVMKWKSSFRHIQRQTGFNIQTTTKYQTTLSMHLLCSMHTSYGVIFNSTVQCLPIVRVLPSNDYLLSFINFHAFLTVAAGMFNDISLADSPTDSVTQTGKPNGKDGGVHVESLQSDGIVAVIILGVALLISVTTMITIYKRRERNIIRRCTRSATSAPCPATQIYHPFEEVNDLSCTVCNRVIS